MSKKVFPSKNTGGRRGKVNAAFEESVDEKKKAGKGDNSYHLEDIVKSKIRAHEFGQDWREYVTQRRREYHLRKDASFLAKGQRKQSMADSHLGLEVDMAVVREEILFKPLNYANGSIPSPRETEQNTKRMNRKLIEHFVMLNSQPHETAEVDLELINNLVQKGADINCADRYGQTILHEAARLWHTDVALFLIEKGADVNKSDGHGRTPLHVAAATDYVDMIELLLEKGANIEAKTSGEKQTPLHFAARNDAVEACKILIKHGAFVEAEDYRKRTPVYVAAELDRSETARWLMENGAVVGICDDTGQSCMTHMITKMGPVAKDSLNTFHKTDRPNRKQYFYLNLLEHDISDESDEGFHGTCAKTPLQVIVSFKQLDIIMHPVILKMLEVKWNDFGRIGAIKLLLLNFLYILIWTALAVGVPWQTRYQYILPGTDVWRIIFWIFAMSSTSYYIVIEIMEIRTSRKRFELWREWKIHNIERDKKFCHKKWPEEEVYLKREADNIDDMVPSYFHDFWNFFDWTVYFLNFFVFITHFINIFAYTPEDRPPPCCATEGCDYTAQLIRQGNYTDKSVCALPNASVNNDCLSVWVNRIFAINIIMMWLRLMKNFRAFRTMGPFVVMLGKITFDVVRFLFLYFEFYIPYACAFWMIFGGEPSIVTMSTVDQMLFSLYRITLVDEYEYDQMHTFDVVMTYFLVGTFLGISAILCINLFIALLSDTFQRVYDNANANAVMQQAILILSIEDNLSGKRRERFNRFISRKCSPREEYYDDDLTTTEGDDLKKATIQVRDQMEEVLDHIRDEKRERENLDEDGDGKRSATVGKGVPRVYAKFATDMSNVVSMMNKYQKGNESAMKKLQRDMKEIKQMLLQIAPRKHFSDRREVLPISDYHQTRDDVYSPPAPVERVMRESSAARSDMLSRMAHLSHEQQDSSYERPHGTRVEMVVLPGASTPPPVVIQNDSFADDAGLPSMQFSSIRIDNTDAGSSHV